MSVGALDGEDAELLGQVVDAARLPDGGIVVLDAMARELRFFRPGEDVPVIAGRSGNGPGEFRGSFGLEVLSGDSIVVWDFTRSVLSYWSATGEFLTERPAGTHRTIHEGALLADGSLVVPRYGGEASPDRGRYRPQAVLILYGHGEPHELGSFPYDEMFAGTRSGAPIPFGARSVVAAGGSPLRIYVADDTNKPRVRVFDGAGELLDEMSLRDTRAAVSSALWEGELARVRDLYGESPELERTITGWGRPDSTPAFHDLQVDSEGRLWVLRQEGSRLLATVYMDGVPVAEVEMPDLSEIFEIGGDYILGLHRDDLDVESVQIYSYASD